MGILVGIEGIDASGKSSIIEPLAQSLSHKRMKVTSLDKKFSNYQNKEIRKYTESIKNMIWYKEVDPYYFISDQGWLFFHALWYSILCNNKVKSDLEKYDIVIVDGWIYKIYCRFLLKQNFNFELLESVKQSIKQCDIIFMLDVSPEVAWKRRTCFKPTELGGYEKKVVSPKESFLSYQGQVRKKLLDIANKENWKIIKADNMTVEEEVKMIRNIILEQYI